MLDEAGRVRMGEGDYVPFAAAGNSASGEYRCSGCGYGITVRGALPLCPMCGETVWERAPQAPRATKRR